MVHLYTQSRPLSSLSLSSSSKECWGSWQGERDGVECETKAVCEVICGEMSVGRVRAGQFFLVAIHLPNRPTANLPGARRRRARRRQARVRGCCPTCFRGMSTTHAASTTAGTAGLAGAQIVDAGNEDDDDDDDESQLIDLNCLCHGMPLFGSSPYRAEPRHPKYGHFFLI